MSALLLGCGAVLLAAAVAGYAAAPALAWALSRHRGRDAGVLLPRRPLAAGPDVLVLEESTVTTGRLQVVAVAPARPGDERNLRWFAGALGHGAEDPVSRALARTAPRGRLSAVAPHPGDGLSGAVDRHPVRVGRPAWLGDPAPDGPGTTVAVEVDHRLLGRIPLGAEPRRGADAALARLRGAGTEPVLVSAAADLGHLAAALGGVRAEAGVDDDGLAALVADLRGQGRVVAVAAPVARWPAALAAADVALCEPGVGLDGDRAVGLDNLGVESAATALDLVRRGPRLVARLRAGALGLAVLAAAVGAAGLTLG